MAQVQSLALEHVVHAAKKKKKKKNKKQKPKPISPALHSPPALSIL